MNPVIRVPQFANTKKLNLAAITIVLLMASGSSIGAQSESTREAAGDVAKPQTSSPTDFVDTLNSTFRETNHESGDTRERSRCFGKVYAERICAKPEHGCAVPALRSLDLPVLG